MTFGGALLLITGCESYEYVGRNGVKELCIPAFNLFCKSENCRFARCLECPDWCPKNKMAEQANPDHHAAGVPPSCWIEFEAHPSEPGVHDTLLGSKTQREPTVNATPAVFVESVLSNTKTRVKIENLNSLSSIFQLVSDADAKDALRSMDLHAMYDDNTTKYRMQPMLESGKTIGFTVVLGKGAQVSYGTAKPPKSKQNYYQRGNLEVNDLILTRYPVESSPKAPVNDADNGWRSVVANVESIVVSVLYDPTVKYGVVAIGGCFKVSVPKVQALRVDVLAISTYMSCWQVHLCSCPMFL